MKISQDTFFFCSSISFFFQFFSGDIGCHFLDFVLLFSMGENIGCDSIDSTKKGTVYDMNILTI